ncbi:hypothetical protein GCM10022247_28880 [Allokutzneria multivorans]|uniref:Uncharacterized protein n=1 Tax=Allokutzneria multivorans TaxID=1142134 RepID=A0ABP7S2I8_9PSEU
MDEQAVDRGLVQYRCAALLACHGVHRAAHLNQPPNRREPPLARRTSVNVLLRVDIAHLFHATSRVPRDLARKIPTNRYPNAKTSPLSITVRE